MKQDLEIAPRRRPSTSLRTGSGRRVNEFLNNKFSDLCELCLCLKVFAACVNFPIYEASRIRIFLPPRREERQVRINIISLSLRPLRLCGKYPILLVAAQPRCASAVSTSSQKTRNNQIYRASRERAIEIMAVRRRKRTTLTAHSRSQSRAQQGQA